MQLRLSDPSDTDRLVNFLRSLGQTATVAAPRQIELDLTPTRDALLELGIYLRVWKVLYPETEVQLVNGEDEAPAA
jgi:hypothetical protein